VLYNSHTGAFLIPAFYRNAGLLDAAVHCGTSSLRSKNFLRSKVRYKIFSRKSEAPQHTSLTLRTTSGFYAAGVNGIAYDSPWVRVPPWRLTAQQKAGRSRNPFKQGQTQVCPKEI
jgi:hypothetical protein